MHPDSSLQKNSDKIPKAFGGQTQGLESSKLSSGRTRFRLQHVARGTLPSCLPQQENCHPGAGVTRRNACCGNPPRSPQHMPFATSSRTAASRVACKKQQNPQRQGLLARPRGVLQTNMLRTAWRVSAAGVAARDTCPTRKPVAAEGSKTAMYCKQHAVDGIVHVKRRIYLPPKYANPNP